MTVRDVDELALRFKADWSSIKACRSASLAQLRDINERCENLVSPDTSVVVFGSLARLEVTADSDLDWTLLIDGITIPEHLTTAREISKALEGFNPPGATGTFGNMASSHNLIHYIGGEDDTNINTTRRILILLESRPLGNGEAYTRVRSNLFKRYLEEDLGLWRNTTITKVPHFLLNDFARYWRMMAVDFADKQRDRFHKGFALRNIKLRMSRKLLYISGLLACFRCQLDFPDEQKRLEFFDRSNALAVTALLNSYLSQPPLDTIASTLSEHFGLDKRVHGFFSAYDEFLQLLGDTESRKRLDSLRPDELATDPTYREARDISHRFGDAVKSIFLSSDNPIGKLTIDYGVF